MGSTVTAKYPFSGKNQVCLIAEEITSADAGATINLSYGLLRTPTITGTTPNGNATWKTLGYVIGGNTTETRTFEEVPSIGHRNIQQLAEIKFECGGNIQLDYQTGRILYFTIASNNGLGVSPVAPGIYHNDSTGVTGLYQHIVYEPEWVCTGSTGGTAVTAYTDGAISDISSFNLIDAYTAAANGQPKVAARYTGCKVDTLNLEFSRDGTIKANFDWKGSQVYPAQATTNANLGISDYLTYEEVFPPVFGKIYLAEWTYPTGTTNPVWYSTIDTGAGGLRASGNLLGDVTVASLTVNNTLEPLFVIGDTTARNMVSQGRKYEGRMTVAYENEKMHTEFMGAWNNTYADDPTGGSALGVGTWAYPWFVADRMKYYQMKLFYDNSSLNLASDPPTNAAYRRIDVTLLGVKFRSISKPRVVNGIIYQDFDFTALMLAPYNSTDKVGGIQLYDATSSANFHSTAVGI